MAIMCLSVGIGLFLIVGVLCYLKCEKRRCKYIFRSPFNFREKLLDAKPPVTDAKIRDQVLKQRFKASEVPQSIDAVVIGSGIGGLAAAAVLSKAGWKVLVLEQHDKAGGCCHTFTEKGFEFDVGIHHVGEVMGNTEFRILMDQITNGQLQWAPLEDFYDTVIFGEDGKKMFIPIPSGKEKLKEILAQYFPDELQNIQRIIDGIEDVYRKRKSIGFMKVLPFWFARFLIKWGIIHWFTDYFQLAAQSADEFVRKITQNEDLISAFAYKSGDYAVSPKEASWVMLAGVCGHYLHGAAYPIGGPSEIPFTIIPVIEKAGGRVLVKAKVKQILIDSSGNASVLHRKNRAVYSIKGPLEIPIAVIPVIQEAGSKVLVKDKVKHILVDGSGKTSGMPKPKPQPKPKPERKPKPKPNI